MGSPISIGISSAKENRMVFQIESMACGGCVSGAARAIRSVDPEALVEADLPSRRLAVQSQKPREALLGALAEAGFPAVPA
jgi:copper chaperone